MELFNLSNDVIHQIMIQFIDNSKVNQIKIKFIGSQRLNKINKDIYAYHNYLTHQESKHLQKMLYFRLLTKTIVIMLMNKDTHL